MVKKTSPMRLIGLALCLVLSVSAFAQEIVVQAVPFHRFKVSNAMLGHYLTPDFNGGVVLNFQFQPFIRLADIVPLVSG